MNNYSFIISSTIQFLMNFTRFFYYSMEMKLNFRRVGNTWTDCRFYFLIVYKIIWYEWHKKWIYNLVEYENGFCNGINNSKIYCNFREAKRLWSYMKIWSNHKLQFVYSDERRSKLAAALKAGKSWTCLIISANNLCYAFKRL